MLTVFKTTRSPLLQKRADSHSHIRFHQRFSSLACSLGLVIGLLFAMPSWAISLNEAKAQGLVGEKINGYLGSPKGASSEVKQLIQSINKKRRSAYQERAKKSGVGLNVMEQRVGQRLIEKAPAGHYIQTPSGSWQKK